MQTVMSIRKPLSILLFVVSEILVILINHFLFLYLLSDHQTFAKFTLAFILCHILLFIIQDSTMYKFTMIYWIVTSFVHIYIRLFLIGPSFVGIVKPIFDFMSIFTLTNSFLPCFRELFSSSSLLFHSEIISAVFTLIYIIKFFYAK